MTRTLKEFAEALHGNEYGDEGSKELFAEMAEAGVVAVFGYSDDIVELRGAIDDELGASEFHVTESGLVKNECSDDDCPYFEAEKARAARIVPNFSDGEYTFTYSANLHHETFEIMEDGHPYCLGIVFDLADAGVPW